MKLNQLFFIFGFFLLSACTKDTITADASLDQTILNNTQLIPDQYKPLLEGVFKHSSGNPKLGNSFVGVWKRNNFCFFSNRNGTYIYFEAGFNPTDSSIVLSGIWRSPILDEASEKVKAIISKEDFSKILNTSNNSYTISCNIIQNNGNEIPFTLEWIRPFSNRVKNADFHILAHRGGGRNADNNPYAENSLKMFTYAEKMGANGIEIDIQLTKDNVPVIYHDPDINIRLTQKSPLVGAISDYNYTFLKNNIKLLDGQEIPTLEESLNIIIDSTELKSIWLDVKVGGSVFEKMKPIIINSIARARAKNRKIQLFFGIPNDEVKQAVLALPNYTEIPTLCELSIEEAKSLKSKAYAPRWTLGTLLDEMALAKAAGILAFTWTLDAQSAIKEYLNKGAFDGILTNYPSILAYEFYIQE
jgi:glycerophosphoryl diester phosphodiesterase